MCYGQCCWERTWHLIAGLPFRILCSLMIYYLQLFRLWGKRRNGYMQIWLSFLIIKQVIMPVLQVWDVAQNLEKMKQKRFQAVPMMVCQQFVIPINGCRDGRRLNTRLERWSIIAMVKRTRLSRIIGVMLRRRGWLKT